MCLNARNLARRGFSVFYSKLCRFGRPPRGSSYTKRAPNLVKPHPVDAYGLMTKNALLPYSTRGINLSEVKPISYNSGESIVIIADLKSGEGDSGDVPRWKVGLGASVVNPRWHRDTRGTICADVYYD